MKRRLCPAQSGNVKVLTAFETEVRVFVNHKGPFVDALSLVDTTTTTTYLLTPWSRVLLEKLTSLRS
jgi:hypothetical protein